MEFVGYNDCFIEDAMSLSLSVLVLEVLELISVMFYYTG